MNFPIKTVITTPAGYQAELVESFNIATKKCEYHLTHKVSEDRWVHVCEDYDEDTSEEIRDLYLIIANLKLDRYMERHDGKEKNAG